MKTGLNELPFTENFPQPCDTKAFQAEIDRLFGFEATTGRSWLRIVWMPAPFSEVDDAGEPLTYDWDEYANGGRGAWRRRYIYSADASYVDVFDIAKNIWYSKEVWNDIAPPRFILERFIQPDIALLGWKASGTDQDGSKWTSRRPTYGRYEGLMLMPDVSDVLQGGMIVRHDEQCCKDARAERVDCYGFYEPPGNRHLEELERLAWLRRKAAERRPGISTHEERVDAAKRTTAHNEEYWGKFGQDIKQIYLDGFKTHAPSLSPDASVRSNGKYHWTAAHNRSGLKKEKA